MILFWISTFLVFILDVGTGLPVAIKTNALKSVYLSKPSIILGDMIIIPLTGGYVISEFRGYNLFEIFYPVFLILVAILAVALAAISAYRFKTTNIWYLPHGLFYVFMAFWYLLFLIGRFDLASTSWWLILSGIALHLYLGKKYPKVFPKIK